MKALFWESLILQVIQVVSRRFENPAPALVTRIMIRKDNNFVIAKNNKAHISTCAIID